MSIACVLSNYLRGSKGNYWVNSISGLKRMLRHNLFMSLGESIYCGDLIGTSDNIVHYHALSHALTFSRKKAFKACFKYYNTAETLCFCLCMCMCLYMLSIYNAYIHI